MADAQSDYDEILALDRAHVIHPISAFSQHERHGPKLFTDALWPEAKRHILAEGA